MYLPGEPTLVGDVAVEARHDGDDLDGELGVERVLDVLAQEVEHAFGGGAVLLEHLLQNAHHRQLEGQLALFAETVAQELDDQRQLGRELLEHQQAVGDHALLDGVGDVVHDFEDFLEQPLDAGLADHLDQDGDHQRHHHFAFGAEQVVEDRLARKEREPVRVADDELEHLQRLVVRDRVLVPLEQLAQFAHEGLHGGVVHVVHEREHARALDLDHVALALERQLQEEQHAFQQTAVQRVGAENEAGAGLEHLQQREAAHAGHDLAVAARDVLEEVREVLQEEDVFARADVEEHVQPHVGHVGQRLVFEQRLQLDGALLDQLLVAALLDFEERHERGLGDLGVLVDQVVLEHALDLHRVLRAHEHRQQAQRVHLRVERGAAGDVLGDGVGHHVERVAVLQVAQVNGQQLFEARVFVLEGLDHLEEDFDRLLLGKGFSLALPGGRGLPPWCTCR